MRRHVLWALAFVIFSACLSSPLLHAQDAGQSALQQQVEKLAAGQEALRKEILAMQKQLLEIRALLQRPASAAAPSQMLPADLSIEGAPIRGAATARLVIVEFSDFQCPFCGRHAVQVYPQLEREYISTGKVKYAYRHFPLETIHPQAFKAGEAAECAAAQNKFWEMHERLFTNQKALLPPDLAKHAQALGLNDAQFNSCLAGQMTARVRQGLTLGAQAGVSATPTFFVGTAIPGGKVKVLRRLNGAVPFASFKSALDSLLANDGTLQ